MNTTIKALRARQILDCKARPMVEVDLITEGGAMGRGSAPTGTSVGMYESYVLRDEDPNEYNGMSVHRAVQNVLDVIAPAIIGMDVRDQEAIDQKMIALDGTPNKRNLGGNAIYSVSIAALRAAADSENVPVYTYLAKEVPKTTPLPTFNLINGGQNGPVKQAFNEFIVAPYRATCVEEAVEMGVMVHAKLESVLQRYTGAPLLTGKSYGYAAPSDDPAQILALLAEAVDQCGYTGKVAYALDCASSEMYDAGDCTYELKSRRVCGEELIDFVKGLTQSFPLLFVEDLMDENDWDGFARAHRTLTKTCLIGDDFTVTNMERLQRAHEMQCVDGFILKPNQVGTLTEAFATHAFAQAHGMFTVPSGRAGGTVGDIVSDLALGLYTKISKNGVPRTGERLDRVNILLRASSEAGTSRICDLSALVRF